MFVDNFNVSFVRNDKIDEMTVDKIIRLKQEYWDYTYREHRDWMEKNIYGDAYHLMIFNLENRLIGYLNVITTFITNKDETEVVSGIGNVCVAKEFSGIGIGKVLMNICNYYLDKLNKPALLLCKESLINFYEKSGWMLYEGEVYIQGEKFEGALLANNKLKKPLISLERKF